MPSIPQFILLPENASESVFLNFLAKLVFLSNRLASGPAKSVLLACKLNVTGSVMKNAN